MIDDHVFEILTYQNVDMYGNPLIKLYELD